MTSLRDTLEQFQAYILEKNPQIEDKIISSKINAKKRLAVYENAYYLRLLEVLEKDYPVLKELLGEKVFDELGRKYIDTYPSSHFSAVAFGRHFDKFLLEPIHSEIATLEWVMNQAIITEDAPIITLNDLKKVPLAQWIDMRLKFHPSVQTLTFYYNAPETYNAVKANATLPKNTHYPEGTHWLVWRKQQSSHFCSILPEQYWIATALQEGKSFGDVCEGLCEWLDEEKVGEFAAHTLNQWLAEEMFSEIQYNE